MPDDIDNFNHRIRNDIVCIQSCIKEIEHYLCDMRMVVIKYNKAKEGDISDGCDDRRPQVVRS
jgi:hypothetical protein